MKIDPTKFRRAIRCLFALALTLTYFAFGSSGQAQVPLPGDAPPEPFQIAASVNLVVLQATVNDRSGQTVTDLTAGNFEVFEDGARQVIRLFQHEDVLVTVGLVVDHSGSMGSKLNDVIGAARGFVRLSNPADEMFVVNFNERATFGLPASVAFTNRSEDLESAIMGAPTTGQTALYDAIAAGLMRLQAGSRDKKVLIVISDGADNASRLRLAQVLKLAERSNAIIYAIGTFSLQDPDRNPGVLRRLAESTGGAAFFPQELQEIQPICERIAREIRSQYTLGYTPASEGKPGAYRKIRVTAKQAGRDRLSVRTRAGYVAAGEVGTVRRGEIQ